MEEYWKLKKTLPCKENQKIISEFLLSLHNANRSKGTIGQYRAFLQKFFKESATSFSHITVEAIYQWFIERQNQWSETTTGFYLYCLHSFYSFCVERGYMEKLPFNTESINWGMQSLSFSKDQKVIGEYVDSLRKSNKSIGTIIKYQLFLERFLKEIKKSPTLITIDDINKWFDEHQKRINTSTLDKYRIYLHAFFKYLVKNRYIEKSPIQLIRDLKKSSNENSLIKQHLANPVNQEMISEYLQNLRDLNRKPETIRYYRSSLETFFKNMDQPFSSLTPEEIQKWLELHQKHESKSSYYRYFTPLHGFYQYCVERDYVKKSPVIGQMNWGNQTKDYWEVNLPLKNNENKNVISEYLSKLKDTDKKRIIKHRSVLQEFFQEVDQPFSSITIHDITLWRVEKEKSLKKSSVDTYHSILRSFYKFCVDQGYLEQNPVQYRYEEEKDEKYWVVNDSYVNPKNEMVVNEYLLSLKIENLGKLTICQYRSHLSEFLKNRETLYKDLLSDEIQNWLNQVYRNKRWKESTFSVFLSSISSFYNFCVEEEYLEKSPIKYRWYPRLPKPVPKYMEKEEVAKIRIQSERSSIRDRVLMEFLLTSGCRIGEVYKLNREDVDLEKRTALVNGKGGKIRKVHFSEKCALLFAQYLDSRTDRHPALFLSKRLTRLSSARMYEIIKGMGQEAKLQKTLHPHRFRHTFATELLAKGAPLSFISEELGHNNLQTSQIYARLPKREIISNYRKYMG